MKAAFLVLTALLLVGCEDTYRYPCQDPANKDKEECNRPACEADGMCYDALNGIKAEPVADPEVRVVEKVEVVETPAPVAETDHTGE